MRIANKVYSAAVVSALSLLGCGGEGGAPETYEFESRFDPGESSVSHSGQAFRHVLIEDLKSRIGGLDLRAQSGDFDSSDAAGILAELDYFFRFDSLTSGGDAVALSTAPLGSTQTVYDDLSSGKDLRGKLAGNDPVTDHRSWTGGDFAGWSDASIATYGGGIDTPEQLVDAIHSFAAQSTFNVANGAAPFIPGTSTPLPAHVSPSGLDLQQLSQKFLTMAVAFSQGADDYLDDDVAGKGLLADNVDPDGAGAAYTALEHAWDEAFGYFGAAHDFDDHDEAAWAAQSFQDADGDGSIDLTSEYSFGASINAAKRDEGSSDEADSDFSEQAFEAFVEGRALISSADGPLSEAQHRELQALRDEAVSGWEGAIAATIVHYINDVLQDMQSFGTPAYSFLDHAKHFSEMKGFALGLQFNPRSRLSRADFLDFHARVGDAPVLEAASTMERGDYEASLRAARALLVDAYGFHASNVGDDAGQDGW